MMALILYKTTRPPLSDTEFHTSGVICADYFMCQYRNLMDKNVQQFDKNHESNESKSVPLKYFSQLKE